MVNEVRGINRREFLKRAGLFILSLSIFGVFIKRRSCASNPPTLDARAFKEAKYYERI